MNSHEEIQAVARDVADRICTYPDDRRDVADGLIRLVLLVVEAVGADIERYERIGLAPVWRPRGNAARLRAGELTARAHKAAEDLLTASQPHAVSAPACGWDVNCLAHGDYIGRRPGGVCIAEASMDAIPDHQYSEACPGTCCGGSEEPATADETGGRCSSRSDCCNPDGYQCGDRCIKSGGCCYLKSGVCPKHH